MTTIEQPTPRQEIAGLYAELRRLQAENARLLTQTSDLMSDLDTAHMHVAGLESTLRQIRRWIEAEDRPGEWTAEIYDVAGKALPY